MSKNTEFEVEDEANTKGSFAVNFENYNTLDDTLESKVAMINAHNTARSLAKDAPETIQVMDVMTEVGVNAKSGNPCQRTYLFCADGNIYFTQSSGIAKTINEFYHDFGEKSFTELPLGYAEMRVKEQSLSGDRTFKQLELVRVQ